MKKGFTITELLVSVGLLAAVLAASSMIFHYSIQAYRTASATAEIMRTFRAITDQLNADFAGFRKGDILYIGNYIELTSGLRADSIVFLPTGSFQTTNTYDGESVRGNTARIYYGQSAAVAGICPDPLSPDPQDRKNKILVRKQVMFEPSRTDDSNEFEPNTILQQTIFGATNKDEAEAIWLARPEADPNNPKEMPAYFAKGVDDFTVMIDEGIDNTDNSIDWWPKPKDFEDAPDLDNYSKDYPDLVKFTFTLYDSKGILKGGRRFEHIVYIGK